MAANNYFSFTHGGTQYGAASAAAYQTAQPGYAVTPAATAATYSPQRAATGYETAYQTAAAAAAPATYAAVGSGTPAAPAGYDYSYATATQTAYNTAAKTYYQQPAAGAAPYSTTETHYQGSKPAYSTTSTYTATTRQAPQGVPKAASYTTSYTAQPTQAAATNYSSGYNTPVVVQSPSNTKPYNTNQANTSATFTTNYNPQSAQSQTPPKPKIANTTYSGYDAAVYNAATLYVAQQTAGATGASATGNAATAAAAAASNTAGPSTVINKIHQGGGGGGNMGSGASGGWVGNYRKGPMLAGIKPAFRTKAAPKPQQVHYCEVCRISCAGPQTYREHLEGQKHKKKEAMMKSGGNTPIPRGVNALKCELCDVDCTGSDAYAAHIRGSRHQKVVKLHTKLGKPIPSTDPVVQGKAGSSSSSTSGTGAKKLVSSTPKINFVATGNLGTVGTPGGSMTLDSKEGEEEDVVDKDVQPVGQDYIEEIKNDDGKQTTFTCKLCDCRFNDPNAKEMHLKGRRHRMQYKKKVNPELVVEVKQTTRQRKQQDEKARRQQFQQEYLRRREEERVMMRGFLYEEEERLFWEERRRYEEEMECYEWYRRYGHPPRAIGLPMNPRPFGPPGPGMPSNLPLPFFPPAMRRPETVEDRYVVARHTDIYPNEEELEAVQKIVSHTEKALKFVSDHLAEESNKSVAGTSAAKPAAAKSPVQTKPATPSRPSTPAKTVTVKKEDGSDGSLFSFQQGKEESSSTCRLLKGVMRVGVLAKGLLLHGDTAVNLVVLCSEKPTRSLLYKVHENLPKQLQVVAPEDSYSVKHKAEDAALVVIGGKEPHITVTITLTSPVMREGLVAPTEKSGDSAQAVKVKDPPDVLDKQKCLEALAALRHAKWFQARATQLQSCVMIIRILRDLCQRVPTWAPLHSWAMELLVEKVLSSTKVPLSPGEALRRVLEALASGILLPGGPGLLDLCEKEPVDAAGSLNAQQREDITASAQQALRLLAFRQIHKVLGMDLLPPLKNTRPRFPRKRRREGSGGEGNDSEAVDGKKDKKDEVVIKMETESSK